VKLTVLTYNTQSLETNEIVVAAQTEVKTRPKGWLNRTVAGAGITSALGDFCYGIGFNTPTLNPPRGDCRVVQFNLRLILAFLLDEYLSPSAV
jgi:hypothetical protein